MTLTVDTGAAVRRLTVRRAAAVVCGLLTATYTWMFVAVRTAETGASENTFGAYAQLAVVYLVGLMVLLYLDRRWLYAVGLAVQVVVVALFVVFGTAIFDYDLVADLPLALWVVVTLLGQALLVGMLGWLALAPAGRSPEGDEPVT